jgi:hypothetical protein
MHHVPARVAATAVLIASAAILLSAASAFAKSDPDNPNGGHDGLVNNPGHHYGQLRHQSPSPVPSPNPTPAPTSTPVTQSPAPTAVPAGVPAPQTQPQATSKIPDVPVSLSPQPSGQVSVVAPRPAGDGLWWLILLILPLLLAIWVVVAARLLSNGLRTVRAPEPIGQQIATAPI